MIVRPMICEDAEAVSRLSGELGYPATPADIESGDGGAGDERRPDAARLAN